MGNDTFIERMQKELIELQEKTEKLRDYIESGRADSLGVVRRNLLVEQHNAMSKYQEILACRVELESTIVGAQ